MLRDHRKELVPTSVLVLERRELGRAALAQRDRLSHRQLQRRRGDHALPRKKLRLLLRERVELVIAEALEHGVVCKRLVAKRQKIRGGRGPRRGNGTFASRRDLAVLLQGEALGLVLRGGKLGGMRALALLCQHHALLVQRGEARALNRLRLRLLQTPVHRRELSPVEARGLLHPPVRLSLALVHCGKLLLLKLRRGSVTGHRGKGLTLLHPQVRLLHALVHRFELSLRHSLLHLLVRFGLARVHGSKLRLLEICRRGEGLMLLVFRHGEGLTLLHHQVRLRHAFVHRRELSLVETRGLLHLAVLFELAPVHGDEFLLLKVRRRGESPLLNLCTIVEHHLVLYLHLSGGHTTVEGLVFHV